MKLGLASHIAFYLIIIGIILVIFGALSLNQGHFAYVKADGVREMVTPQNNPNLYWGMCLGPLFVGAAGCAAGIYLFLRKKN